MLMSGVIDDPMRLEMLADSDVSPVVVGHDRGILGDLFFHDRLESVPADRLNMEGTDFAATFNEREDFLFVTVPTNAFGLLSLVAPIGFVNLNNRARAAKRRSKYRVSHGFSDSVSHKPSGFIGDSEHPVNLMAGATLLGSGQEMEGQ